MEKWRRNQNAYIWLIDSNKCKVKFLGGNDPIMFKDYFVSCCRWGLNLSYGDSEKFTNPFRLYYMTVNGMPVLADGGHDGDDYLAICKVIDFSHFPEHLNKDDIDVKSLVERCRANSLSDNLKHVLWIKIDFLLRSSFSIFKSVRKNSKTFQNIKSISVC